MHDPEPKLRQPADREKTREEKLEDALRYYATADFLTTEQQQRAEDALKIKPIARYHTDPDGKTYPVTLDGRVIRALGPCVGPLPA